MTYNKKVTEEELNELVKKPEATQTVIQEITMGCANIQVVNMVEDIKEKYDGIYQLEQNVEHIRNLLDDMKTLILDQGDQIDNIHDTIGKAKDYAKKGEQNLEKAKKYHAQAKKRQWWLFCCIFVTLIIVAGPIVLTILNQKGMLLVRI